MIIRKKSEYTELWRHKKTGDIYEVICVAVLESNPDVLMVVYRNEVTGDRWVLPGLEFNDGRFERVEENNGN